MLQILCKTPTVIFNFKIQILAYTKEKFKIQRVQPPRVNSLFQSNLENLLDSLPSKDFVSHFDNTSIGNGLNKVNGAFLCLNYITK